MLLVLYNNLATGGGPTSYFLQTTPGTYTITGSSASVNFNRLLDVTPGSYAVTGSSADLQYNSILVTQPGSYTVTGADANLFVETPNKILETEAGNYTITGFSANLLYSGEEQILKPGGKGLSPWQLRQQRLEALKKDLWYLYQDENDEELKEAILEVVQNNTNLDELLSVLRKQLTLVRNLYDKAQQEQYQKAFEAAQQIKQAKIKQRNEEEVAAMLLF